MHQGNLIDEHLGWQQWHLENTEVGPWPIREVKLILSQEKRSDVPHAQTVAYIHWFQTLRWWFKQSLVIHLWHGAICVGPHPASCDSHMDSSIHIPIWYPAICWYWMSRGESMEFAFLMWMWLLPVGRGRSERGSTGRATGHPPLESAGAERPGIVQCWPVLNDHWPLVSCPETLSNADQCQSVLRTTPHLENAGRWWYAAICHQMTNPV